MGTDAKRRGEDLPPPRGHGVGAPAPFPDGFHPFWFWNARIDADELRRQIARMSEQGVRGFFIHSRQGLAQPYMSRRFLDLVEMAIDEGRARGMSVHLYDEYPYPSGAAGGAVVQSDPALAGTTLQVEHRALPAGPVRVELPAGKVLVCRAFPLRDGEVDWGSGLDLREWVGMALSRESYHDAAPQTYNDRRFFADTPVPTLEVALADGPVELWAVSQVPVREHKYWDAFPDVTNPAAVRRFIELTHERYRQHLGPKLAEVASIFVDEVEPLPSASVMAEVERRDQALFADTVLAFVAPSHPAHVEALRAVEEARLALFEKSFEAPVSEWCHNNGLRYTGEKPSIRLSQLAWMDVPGCEPGHTKAGAERSDLLQGEIRGNAKATASAAYFFAKEGSLCECYHSLGWGATLQDAKLIAESLLLLGTRWLVPHAFFYSIDGLRKHDAPPSFFHMPYWSLFGELTSRVAAISHAFEGTWLDASIGVVEPAAGMPDVAQLACYEDLQWALLHAHLDFLTVDLPILAAGHIAEASVFLRDIRLRSVLVPPGRCPRPELDEWLAKFERAGGQVVRVAGAQNIDDAVGQVRSHCPPALSVTAQTGDAAAVQVACRRGEKGRNWIMVNTSPQPAVLEVVLADGAGLAPVQLENRWVRQLEQRDGTYQLRLEGFESALVQETSSPVTEGPRALPLVRVATDGPWAFKPLGMNVLRLGRWLMSLPDQGQATAVVEPAPIANQLLRSGLPFAPRIIDHFGRSPSVGFPPLRARYETTFDCCAGVPLQLVMQPGSLTGDWCTWVDGSGPYRPGNFSPSLGPVAGCIGMPIACDDQGRSDGDRLHRHVIVVEVQADRGEQGLRDSIYIGGDFGVFAPEPGQRRPGTDGDSAQSPPLLATTRPLPTMGDFGAWEANGLPYYAGAVEYSRRSRLSVGGAGPEVVVQLDLPAGCEDAAEVAFGTGPFRPLPWSPRRTLVPRAELEPGKAGTLVRALVLSTLERAFEGRRFGPREHTYGDVELAYPAVLAPPSAEGLQL